MNIWYNKEAISNKLILLKDNILYTSGSQKENLQDAKNSLQSNKSPGSVLSQKAIKIALNKIVKILSDKNDTEINIHYQEEEKLRTESLDLSSKEEREEVYHALKIELDEQFNEFIDKYSLVRSIYGSLLALSICGLLTWGMANAATYFQTVEEIGIKGRTAGFKLLAFGVLKFVGPTPVVIVGSILGLLFLLRIVQRLKSPPEMLILQKEIYKPETALKTILKYAMLIAIWLIAVTILI